MEWLNQLKVSYILPIILAGLLISCGENTNKNTVSTLRPVKVMQIDDPLSFKGRLFPGRAKASREVNLSFNIPGSLTQLPVIVGTIVKKGDLIATLDQREFAAKLKSAKAEAFRDIQNYQRAKELVAKDFVSRAEYELMEAKSEVSQANVDLAEKTMKDSILIAPFEGKIASVYVENFQTVASKEPIARLLDISQIEMVLQIPESAISFIPYVKQVQVVFDAFPNRYIPAEIKEISNEASSETRTYPVTVVMRQPNDLEILPGMAGKAGGKLSDEAGVTRHIAVPISAVLTIGSDNKTYVYLYDEKSHRVHLKEVNTGDLTPTGIAIKSGLKPGDLLVVAGIHSLTDGDEVALLPSQGK